MLDLRFWGQGLRFRVEGLGFGDEVSDFGFREGVRRWC